MVVLVTDWKFHNFSLLSLAYIWLRVSFQTTSLVCLFLSLISFSCVPWQFSKSFFSTLFVTLILTSSHLFTCSHMVTFYALFSLSLLFDSPYWTYMTTATTKANAYFSLKRDGNVKLILLSSMSLPLLSLSFLLSLHINFLLQPVINACLGVDDRRKTVLLICLAFLYYPIKLGSWIKCGGVSEITRSLESIAISMFE